MARAYVRLGIFCSTDTRDKQDAKVLEIKGLLGERAFSPFAKQAIVEKFERDRQAKKDGEAK